MHICMSLISLDNGLNMVKNDNINIHLIFKDIRLEKRELFVFYKEENALLYSFMVSILNSEVLE